MMGAPSETIANNAAIAALLRDYASMLRQQGDDGFRIAAYERAADVVDGLARPAAAILAEGGRQALTALPAIGDGIAAAIAEMVTTGRWSQLDRLRGSLESERLFRTIPGIGAGLAGRIADELHVETLEELEAAAHDGRLQQLSGFGPRRAAMIQTVLAERLGRPRFRRARGGDRRPPVADILSVDREYRQKSDAGDLALIAPKRFNPEGKAWLPILHARRGPFVYTVLFSNTRLAHELGRTRDWVVVYYEAEGLGEGQCTVVTETRGALAGQRVVRGREAECASLGVTSADKGAA